MKDNEVINMAEAQFVTQLTTVLKVIWELLNSSDATAPRQDVCIAGCGCILDVL
jgi:hypothetical protein